MRGLAQELNRWLDNKLNIMTIEPYIDQAGEYRWRLKSRNGRIVADSAEGYTSNQGLKKAIASFQTLLKTKAKVKDIPIVPEPEPEPTPEPPIV